MKGATVFRILSGLLIAFLISAVIAFAVIVSHGTCSRERSPTYCDLYNGLDHGCHLKSKSLRLMAERIYQYRVANEVSKPNDLYVSLFMAMNSTATPPDVATLSDVALFKVATATTVDFNILLSYIPIFNHPRYVECLQAFKSGKFQQIDATRSTRDIIILDVLGLGSAVEKSIKSYETASNAATTLNSQQTDDFIKKVTTDSTSLGLNESTVSQLRESIKAYLSQLNSTNLTNTFDQSDEFIKKVLIDSSDLELYNLLQSGYGKSVLT